ncbi:MAG TPA: malto-oligosyltrehalose trehalohydrolase [Candidatus Sulfopaludibacter sp.]|jgi:maltooligosyltrehalose trehalohydrolase|nr:malto-oligosyltrehalose trehalohydrolase [Candidatus Sulfopaludibacter sp.]
MAAAARRFPIGAEVLPEGGVSFRLWAPRPRRVEVVLEAGGATEMKAEGNGYFSVLVPEAGHGARYRFRLDGGDAFPDPASRFQPEGPHGPSQVIDPSRFSWTDSAWTGASLRGQVIYELHPGTFTPEGTWQAAREQLAELATLGITTIELMPVADFPGRFGWGYDGVGWFAPVKLYGEPDELRQFVNDAHNAGIAVVLDVVYNHFGPDGNYIKQFSESYFTDKYVNEWGEALNFDGPDAAPVREFVCTNAAYWASEFHMDGLRLDATQQIFDESKENIMTALARSFRAAARGRKSFIVAENESQHCRLVRPVEQHGYGLDGLWNDDFHHTVRVAATGHNEAYYTDYHGCPQELISAVKYGYIYQGQRYQWQSKRRGSPAWGLEPWQFVNYIQNHDQIANSGRGDRLNCLTTPGRYRALSALLLLAPGTPMLFQGQEFAASSPFLYFADHQGDLGKLVREGRVQFLAQFPSLAQSEMRAHHPDPGDLATFERCKLDLSERVTHACIYQMYKDLLRLRRTDPVFRSQLARGVDGAVIGGEALVLRFFAPDAGDRLLLVNLGRDLILEIAPEPLLAPPEGRLWATCWSSEDPAYGGAGTAPFSLGTPWRIPGHAAVVLAPGAENGPWQI